MDWQDAISGSWNILQLSLKLMVFIHHENVHEFSMTL